MPKQLDLSAAWNRGLSMLADHKDFLLVLAGIFFFLPNLAVSYFIDNSHIQAEVKKAETAAEIWAAYSPAIPSIMIATVITAIASIIGTISIFSLLLRRDTQSVQQAFSLSIRKFFTVLLSGLMAGFATMIGFAFFFFPGIYLWVKFLLASPAIVAEDIGNPVDALKRSWSISKSNSLRIFFYILIIAVVGLVIYLIIGGLFSVIFALVLPDHIGLLLSKLVAAFLMMLLALVLTVNYAAIYEQLSGRNG